MVRSLWQPPRLRVNEDDESERHATWLELFFDLVFVVAISELAHNLSEDTSPIGFLGFVALFIPIWWCWVGATFYATRFDTDDLSHRLLTLLQMAIIAVMAVNVHYGLGKTYIGYALSYAAFRGVLVLQYLNAGYHVPVARPFTTWYARGFSLGVLAWIASTLVAPPWRFGLGILGLVIDFGTPLTAGRLVARVPPSFSHILERIGLFTIIVLGESIIAVVRGISDQVWTTPSVLIAFLGLSIAFSLWWIYFDSVDSSPLQEMRVGKMSVGLIWLYTHLPLAIGLAATGVGVEHAIKYADKLLPTSDRWLLCGSVALCLISLAGLHWITCVLGARRKALVTDRLVAAAGVLIIALFGAALPVVVVVQLVAIVSIIQVVLGLFRTPHVQV